MPVDDTPSDFDDDFDHTKALIAFLSDKDPDLWFAVSKCLNWDNACGVLDWIISQPQCDKANAAYVFWGADALYHLRNPGQTHAEGHDLLHKVLNNWRAGFYTRQELALNESFVQDKYRAAIKERPGGDDPLNIPAELMGVFRGREPIVPHDLAPQNNVTLYDLIYGLGTDVGPRPGSAQWHESRKPGFERRRERAQQRSAILYFYKDIFGFWLRSLKWLALFFVAAMTIAIVARYLVKGVWL